MTIDANTKGDPLATARKVAFLGLGTMGFPMAGHLARTGHAVTVYNRTAARAEAWVRAHGGQTAPTPEEAATGADAVFLCVGGDDDVRAVATEAITAMAPGTVIVDHSTISAVVSREMDGVAHDHRVFFLDAPVSGGQAGAESGALTVMVGGDAGAFDRTRPLMAAYGRSVVHMGPSGAGQLTKMVNQICIAGLVQALAEGMNFARKAGLDGHKVVDVLSKGAAQSWQMDNRARTMLDGRFDFGFAVDWMRKDLGIVLDEARRNGSTIPVTALVDQFYAEVQAMGGNRLDTSSLMKRLMR
ncbi:3-hydroxyisobutyrate dehydrogenase [Azospirillum lipoferum]|uniref:NAD(P)-dependent oxidoreductase n=1 Tax=Azospirillum lipoferum TaxID=193 RepID=A0A5A9GXB1_AZOLI|nr:MULTISPECIES: NAD(P)-dependent oxidoreductase [Azospirillum]KAA0598214.1 NAD(P)-dependent oxidoreductase [Azospirillum lipoferum]MCP1609806.1 3-hydroxyisobutyrate dehydrogenase [Azospirillum lipoferum]MDW5534890.1 NAD(P)-dependent oxidoreductase [Azospirillum sp. NL1]